MSNLLLKKIKKSYLVNLNNQLFFSQEIYLNNVLNNNVSNSYYYFFFVLKVLYRFGFISFYNNKI